MYKKGTIVLVPFPFTDLSGAKVRPAVIISDGAVGNDVIVVFITSNTKYKGKHTLPLTPSKTNGLKAPSRLYISKIATLESSIILGDIGTLTDQETDALNSKLCSVLALK